MMPAPFPARGWLAAFVALPAANLASAVCVQVIIALSVGRFDRSDLKTIAILLAGVAAVNVAVGRIAVSVLWDDPAAVIPLLAVAGVLAVGYRVHSELQRRHRDLEQVYHFSRAVEGLVEPDQVIQAVLSQAKGLLRSGLAELVLESPEGDTRYRIVGDGDLTHTTASGPHPLHRAVVDSGHAVLARTISSDPDVAAALDACGCRDAVAALVVIDEGIVGTLVVADRLGDNVTLEPADRDLLEALASHTAMALRSSQLLDRLRREVAAKDHQSLHDALTGLGNRTLFAQQIEDALAGAPTSPSSR